MGDVSSELRRDQLTGSWVGIAGARQGRPNRPTEECPFCVGGLEAPEAYEVRAGEVGSGTLTNPVVPEAAAEALRHA